MVFFTILAWILAILTLAGEWFLFHLCFVESDGAMYGLFLLLTVIWFFLAYLAFLILYFVAALFQVLVDEYGEETVIGGAVTILLLGIFFRK
jgi:hypothetical protein